MGLAFENLVVNNYRLLLPLLHLDGVVITSAGPYLRRGTISREIIADVDRKVRAIKRREGVSIRTALVYDGHLAPIAKADGYFDAILVVCTPAALSGEGRRCVPRMPFVASSPPIAEGTERAASEERTFLQA